MSLSASVCVFCQGECTHTERENPPVTFEENECGYVCVCVCVAFIFQLVSARLPESPPNSKCQRDGTTY
jgi:hypothetical protein